MVERCLITTADERTWSLDQPVLFLGEWCRRHSRKSVWQKMDSLVFPYHWDDRKKLYSDYLYIQEVYEDQLKALRSKLNHLHNVDRSLRYWRILIGPWLGVFVQILFDRWFMLKQAIEQGDVKSCKILYRNDTSAIPNDMAGFPPRFNNDDWNEQIYGQLIEMFWGKKIDVEKVHLARDAEQNVAGRNNSLNFFLKSQVKKLSSLFYPLTVKSDEYFFISSYLTLKTDFQLQIRLGQFPKQWQVEPPANKKPDMNKRQWITDSQMKSDGFLEVVRQFIPLHIPTAYLEGYEELVRKTKGLPWPQKPKAIFTSNSYSFDDTFKAWTADKTEAGFPLVIGQHGGHFGMTPWSFYEDHQIRISDVWLSWGWSDNKNPKIKPVGNLKEFGRNIRHMPTEGGLMVGMTVIRYSYQMFAVPVAGQWVSYFEDQCGFVAALPKQLQDQLLVRFDPNDHGWDQKDRWGERFPNVKTDPGVQPIRPLIARSRLVICTYNSTTYLEALTWDIPVIIFWNPEHWELKEEVKPYFEQLKSVGIFHETPESAANQMAAVWDNVAGWWKSEEVQKVRRDFCEGFSRKPDNPIDKLEDVFKELV